LRSRAFAWELERPCSAVGWPFPTPVFNRVRPGWG
jgi:hypothetical protein